MDHANTGLISQKTSENTKVHNQPKHPNLESLDIINHPQQQGEIKKEGPSVIQLFKSGNDNTSFNPKVQQSQEINFLAEFADAPLDGTLGQSQADELVQDQERIEQAASKKKSLIYAKSEFNKSGFANVASKQKWSSQKAQKERQQEEIGQFEAEKVDSENDEDADPIVDLIFNLRDKNEGSFPQDMKENKEEKFGFDQNEVLHSNNQEPFVQVIEENKEEEPCLNVSEVFEGSNDENQESLVKAIEEINEERLDFNGNDAFESWSENNEEQFPQDVEERIEENFYLDVNKSSKDSNGNNEYSTIQNREDCLNMRFNMNAHESFELSGSLYEVNFIRQQEIVHQCNEIRNNEHLFAATCEFRQKGLNERAEELAFKFYLSLIE